MDAPPKIASELIDKSPAGVRERLTEELRHAGCVFAEDEADMLLESLNPRPGSLPASDGAQRMRDFVDRRRRGEPPEYILGSATFGGVRVAVGPGVFIPRGWTERLVSRAVAFLDGLSRSVAVDLGTGSGALALAVHAGAPRSRIWAVEIDPDAAAWARRNCEGLAGLTVCIGDLYEALPRSLEHEIDLIFGSLPYVPSRELELLPRDHLVSEPRVAFDGGVEGLTPFDRALANAGRWLRPEGRVLLEIGVGQGPAAEAVARREGFRRTVIHRDADGDELFVEASGRGPH
jgi:release factor glutamine methyltransferase